MARGEGNFLKNLQPAVVISERTLDETRCLALRVLGLKFKTLVYYYSILAIPFYLIDMCLWKFLFPDVVLSLQGCSLEQWAAYDSYISRDLSVILRGFSSFSLLYLVCWLTVALETAFVGSLATQYLGKWFFAPNETIRFREVFRAWRQRLGQLFYYLIAARPFQWSCFYPEVILLEQTPFRGGKKVLTTRKRVKRINKDKSLLGTRLSTELVYLVNGVSWGYFLLLWCVWELFPEHNVAFFVLNNFLFPIFLFGCRLYNVSFNFFQYINCRIVNEGWDLVLAVQEEVEKLKLKSNEKEKRAGTTRGSQQILAPASLERELIEPRAKDETEDA